MKSIIYKFLSIPLLLFLVIAIGCQDILQNSLNRADDSRETLEGILNDPNKVRGMLTACYAGMHSSRTDLYFWTTEESLTDNAFDSQGQSVENWRSGLLSPSFSAVWANRGRGQYTSWDQGSWWGRFWGAIRQCNTFIENVDKITVPLDVLPQSERDLMLDEAIAMRAYFHFKLISMYGPLPFMDENRPVTFAGWSEMTRPTYDEIANRIAEELQGVIDRGNVPMKREPTNVQDKYRVPLGFIYGLKSRVLLYNASPLNNPEGDQAKYQAAADAAKQFLDQNAYNLVSFSETKKMYTSSMAENLEQNEVIWRKRDNIRQFNNVHGMNLSATQPQKSLFPNHKAGETPTQEIVDSYELKNGALVVESYDASHANPTFTNEALAAGYDDENAPYTNRDDRFYRDILYNGSDFGESYQMGPIQVWTYKGAPGTGTNGNTTQGDQKKTFTGYYFAKDRDPIWYGRSPKGPANQRVNHHAIVMRYAEIWLNYAEALAGAGQFDAAADALDKTRIRANQPSIRDAPGYQAGDLEWLMKRIRNERRVELVLEDHRFYDVRRWDLISDQDNNTISGMLIEQQQDGSFTHTRYKLPFIWECHNEEYKVLPIPIEDKKQLQSMEQPEAWQ